MRGIIESAKRRLTLASHTYDNHSLLRSSLP